MISPESDFATFTYFLRNPGDVGDQFSQFTKEADQLILSILSTNLLPETIADYTNQFINDDIPNSVTAVLNLTDLTDNFKDSMIEYFSNVILLITWGISQYNTKLYSVLFEILDKSKPFYQQENTSPYRTSFYFDEDTYKKVIENFQAFGTKDAIINSIHFENRDQEIILTVLQMTEWFQYLFKLEKIINDYEIQPCIDIFADFLNTNKAKFTKFNDFEMIKSCFSELRDYMYHLPREQNDIDFHISKLFDFALWCIDDSEVGPNSRRFTVAIEFFKDVLQSLHPCSTDCLYIYAQENNLLQKILNKGSKNSMMNDIILIAAAFAEKESANLIDSASVLNIYNMIISTGCFSNVKSQFQQLLTYCNIKIIDDLSDLLLKSYSDESVEIFETILCRTKTSKQNEIIDYLLNNTGKEAVKNCLKEISGPFLDDDIKQLLFEKYFNLYLNDHQNENLASIFSIMIKFCEGDVAHKLISMVDLNRKAILKELQDYYFVGYFKFTGEDILKLSKVIDDDLFNFLHFIIQKHGFGIFEPDAISIIDKIAHGKLHKSLNDNDKSTNENENKSNDDTYDNRNNNNDDGSFNITEKQLTLPYVQFLNSFLKKKQKMDKSQDVILFKGYKDLFNLILLAKEKDIVKLLMHIFIKLSGRTKSDYDSLQALSNLIKESIGFKSKDENTTSNEQQNNNENTNNNDDKESQEKDNHNDEDYNKIDLKTVNTDMLKINVDDDKYSKIIKLVKEYIETNEKASFPDLYNFNVERHDQSNKTIKLTIKGCGIDKNFIFPEYINLNGVKSYLNNLYEDGSDIIITTEDGYLNSKNYPYGLTSHRNLSIESKFYTKLKSKWPVPLSIKLHESHFQQILYKQLSSDDAYVKKISFKLLQFLPEDPSISIINQQESNYIKKNKDSIFEGDFQNEEFNIKKIVDRINDTKFSQLQLEYQLEILKKYTDLCKQFRKSLKCNGFIEVLFKHLDENTSNSMVLDMISDIKIQKINENILNSLFKVLIACQTQKAEKYTIVSLLKKSIEKDPDEFTKAFNADKTIKCFDNLLSTDDDYLYSFIKKTIVPSLTNLIPLFNILMKNITKIYENTNYKKILLKIIPLVRDGIDYNSIIQNQILPEQKNHPNSSITIELISAFKPTEHLSSLVDSIDNLLYETSDEEMQKAIFELISSYRSIEMEEKLIPYFSIDIDRWNYDPSHEQKSETGFCGLRNLGATCYFNSILQLLFFTKPFCQLVLQQKETNVELRKIFSSLVLSNQKSVDTSILTSVWKGWESKPINPHEQQDAFEFFQMFLDKLPSEFHQFFQGKLVNIYKGIDLNEEEMEKFGTFENTEDFFAIQLVIKDFNNINESFNHFISPDILNEENQIYRESLGRKVDAEKITRIEKAPPFLVIQLKRFEYNYMTHVRDKIMTSYEFDTSIFINKLMKNYGENTENFFYSLYGIVLHSGTADSGHYSALIKAGNKWYLFNDYDVELFCEAESFDKKISTEFFRNVEQYQPVPYLLFYQRIEVPTVAPPPPQSDQSNVISNTNNNKRKESDKPDGEIYLSDLVQYVCDEDKKEIHESNQKFSRIQWLFNHDCFDFIKKSISQKLRFTYLFKVLGHSKNFNKFQSEFFNSFNSSHNSDGQKLEELDNKWLLDFLVQNIDELQEIIIHANSIDSLNEFVHERFSTMPINEIFPYYHSFAKNLIKMAQLWRKVISFTSPMSDFVGYSDEAINKARENGWVHLSANFIEEFYANNPNKVPLEGINLTNLFTVIESIILQKGENYMKIDEEDINVIKSRFNLILQSKEHMDSFYKLLIKTFPLIIDSTESFILACDDDRQRYNIFETIFENEKLTEIFEETIKKSITGQISKVDKNDFLITLLQYAIDKVNGKYKEGQSSYTTYNFHMGRYETVHIEKHDKEFIKFLINKFDSIVLPLVFANGYSVYAGKLISDMFYDVKPAKEVISDYENFDRENRDSYNYYDEDDGCDGEMENILVIMVSYLKNKLENEKLESNSAISNNNDKSSNENENDNNANNSNNENNNDNNEDKRSNDNENDNNANNSNNDNNEDKNNNNDNNKNAEVKSSIELKTFLLLAAWIIERNNLFTKQHFDELMDIRQLVANRLSISEREILLRLLLEFPPDVSNGHHISSILSEIGYTEEKAGEENENEELDESNKAIFKQILHYADEKFNDDRIVQAFGPEWFIRWLSKAWKDTVNNKMCDNRQQITKIVDVLAHKCPPSLNLIIDFLNKVTTEEITILLNLYMEKTLDLLPFETINSLVTYAVFTFSDKHVAVSPIKKRKFLISINMLIQRVDELESIENNRRKELRSNNNNNENGNDDDEDVVHYRFTLDLKNKKMRFNALIKAIDKVEYPKYVVTFINELIPRLNEEDKSVFIAQLCMYDDYVVMEILGNLGEFRKLINLIENHTDALDENYDDVFTIIANEAFKNEMEHRKARAQELDEKMKAADSKDQNKGQNSNENQNQAQNENESQIPDEKENQAQTESQHQTQSEKENQAQSESQNSSEKENQAQSENDGQSSNEKTQDEGEFKIDVDGLLIHIFTNMKKVSDRVISPLIQKRQPDFYSESFSLVKNVEAVVDSLVNRTCKYDLMHSISLIVMMINSMPQTRSMFAKKLENFKDTIRVNYRSSYVRIFESNYDDTSSSSSSSSSSDNDTESDNNEKVNW